MPPESEWNANPENEDGPNDLAQDSRGMAQVRDDLATDMWNNRGTSRI